MPPDRQQRESFSDYYDRPAYDAFFRWIDIRKRGIIRKAFATLPRGALILDLGCGIGAVPAAVRRPEDTVIAGDLDLSLLQGAARRDLSPTGLTFDGPLPFSESAFDAITIIDALEHTESPRDILDEIYRILKPGGTLVVFTPPYDSHTWIAAEKLHNFVTRRASDHISPFTRESLAFAVGRRFTDVLVGTVNLGLSMYAIAVK